MKGETPESHIKLSETALQAILMDPQAEKYFTQSIRQLINFVNKRALALETYDKEKEILIEKLRQVQTFEQFEALVDEYCVKNNMTEYERTMGINAKTIEIAKKEGRELAANRIKLPHNYPTLEIEIEGHVIKIYFDFYYLSISVDSQLWAHFYRNAG